MKNPSRGFSIEAEKDKKGKENNDILLTVMQGNQYLDLRMIPRVVFEIGTSALFWIALAIFLIMSSVLVYHWKRFGHKSRAIYIAEIVYFLGALALFALAGIAAQSL